MTLPLLFEILLAVVLARVIYSDLKYFRIGDFSNGMLALLGLLSLWFNMHTTYGDAVLGCIVGSGLFWLVRFGYYKVRGFHGLGFGDVKFVAAAGIWTGLEGMPPFLFLTTFSALTAVLILALVKRKPIKGGEKIPFGPFLAIGLFTYWIGRPWIDALFYGQTLF